jgi:hypothetical protein
MSFVTVACPERRRSAAERVSSGACRGEFFLSGKFALKSIASLLAREDYGKIIGGL